jgi:hypothetical protein
MMSFFEKILLIAVKRNRVPKKQTQLSHVSRHDVFDTSINSVLFGARDISTRTFLEQVVVKDLIKEIGVTL